VTTADETSLVTTSTLAATTTVPITTMPPVDEATAWALTYTGGVGGIGGVAAGAPITIGYVNDDASFPENTIGLDAAVAFANAELGGAAGRPIEVVRCAIAVPEDGARCGAELAGNPAVAAVVVGTSLVGNADLYAALDGVKPVIIGNGVTTRDFTTSAGVVLTAGTAGLIPGLGGFVTQRLTGITSVAVLVSGAPGEAAAKGLLKPLLDKAGIASVIVQMDDVADPASVQARLVDSRASATQLWIPLLTETKCAAVDAARRALALNPAVVATGLCIGQDMSAHLESLGESGPVPDGWYVGGYGYNYFAPDLPSGSLTYVRKVAQYGSDALGLDPAEISTFAGPTFANVLTLIRFINANGGDTSFAGLDSMARNFTGPMMLQVGPLSCGNQVIVGTPGFFAVCGSQIGVQQFTAGRWVSVADGLNGNPIDISLL
jgi:branched-chain amino acid transport system substrate-binding protein